MHCRKRILHRSSVQRGWSAFPLIYPYLLSMEIQQPTLYIGRHRSPQRQSNADYYYHYSFRVENAVSFQSLVFTRRTSYILFRRYVEYNIISVYLISTVLWAIRESSSLPWLIPTTGPTMTSAFSTLFPVVTNIILYDGLMIVNDHEK